ncbi:MAG: winged helix DNA-binding domain-containing protein [Flavobacterium sp.]|nr:MAG: winged helix DNA-binding domain-containing protein [Flavobacterium sp.]
MAFNVASARLRAQLLMNKQFTSPAAVVSHFGAMQAQDYQMSKWAVGSRLIDSTDSGIEAALDKGEIIRTHLLRPTWHLAVADDIHWMLEHTGDNILRQMNSSNRQLGLDEKTLRKSADIIAKALEGGNHLTSGELMEILSHSGINTQSYRSQHIMMYAEVKGIVCNGARKGKNHSYALLDERVKRTKNFSREEALAELARRYFTSHAPATQKDFGWWSGLSVADSKLAIELNLKNLESREINGQIHWAKSFDESPQEKTVFLLPAFDEYLISYKDRSASIHIDHTSHAFTSNGIFRPLIVVNGQVAGIWKRTIVKEKVRIEFTFFEKKPKAFEKELLAEASKFAEFIGKTPEMIF